MTLSIRPATVSDAPSIREIYAPVVRSSVATFETEVPSLEEMERRVAEVSARHPWLVAENEGAVVGYAYAAAYHPRPAYAWSCEVSVYVGEAARGVGAGRTLLRALLDERGGRGFVNATARSALPNDASVKLFEAHGFERVGLVPGIGYKLGRWVDVGEWQRELTPRGPNPKPPRSFGPI